MVARTRLAAGVASVLLVLLAGLPFTLARESGSMVVAGAITATMLLGAVGCVAYIGASFAIEQLTVRQDELSHLAERRSQQRRGRRVQEPQVRAAVADGAGTARELAEVLEVYEYVAHKMVRVMLADGALVLDGDRVVVAPSTDGRALPSGPRWIGSDA